MKNVRQFSEGERQRYRDLVLGADGPELRKAGTVVTVEFAALEAVNGRDLLGLNVLGKHAATTRLDVTARKLGTAWFVDVRKHGERPLLESIPSEGR